MVKNQEQSTKNDKLKNKDDIIFEIDDVAEENLAEGKNSFGSSPKKKEDKLKKCIVEKQEYLEGWQRAKADLINAKKDFEEQRKNFVNFAKGDLVIQLIPVLDSFEMAFKKTDKVPEQWLAGVKHIQNQMMQILEENGVREIDPKGKKFDASVHEAVEMVKVDDKSHESIILEVVQKGYELNGKVLREAKVKVGEK